MKLNFHLVVSKNGSVRVLKGQPNLHFDEVSIRLNLEIPDAVFERPQFCADLTVPETAIQSTEIPVELTDQIHQAIQQITGLEVKLTLLPSPEKEVSNG